MNPNHKTALFTSSRASVRTRVFSTKSDVARFVPALGARRPGRKKMRLNQRSAVLWRSCFSTGSSARRTTSTTHDSPPPPCCCNLVYCSTVSWSHFSSNEPLRVLRCQRTLECAAMSFRTPRSFTDHCIVVSERYLASSMGRAVTPSPSSNKAGGQQHHLSKDGNYYRTYQEMRDANVRFNEQRLKEKGLDVSSFKAAFKTVTPQTKAKVIHSTHSTRRRGAIKSTPTRRSARIRVTPPENKGLTEEDFVRIEKKSLFRKKIRKKDTNELTAEQRQNLSSNADWLEEMEEYLLKVEEVSSPNCRTVMRQVEKLVSGAGISYGRWDDHVIFQKGRAIKLSDNFLELYNEAVDFEDEHGRDLGNGWLMRHPIKKLENFQLYCHDKPK